MSTPTDSPALRETTFLDAVNEALVVAMETDERVIVMGEDIAGGAGQGAELEGKMGGTFGATKGLLERFGAKRVRDTPISEAGITAAAVGAAMSGLRPVVDLMWASFAPSAFDQIVNQAAKLRYMSGGQARIPLVLRMAAGAGLRAAAQHSDTLYPLFAHIPGLEVAVPADAAEARGLLLQAIELDHPVVVLEHIALYRTTGMVSVEPSPMPFGRIGTVRTGTDLTMVGVGHATTIAAQAADELAEAGVDAEVVSIRTIQPIDHDGICESVSRTGRLIVIEESPPNCAVSSEVSASVSERLFGALRAPVQRVNCRHSPVPFSPVLEDAHLPSVADVVAACRRALGD
jgi:pyruvate/2-oxoglutarate/acetoin dehydrogenase E1 component